MRKHLIQFFAYILPKDKKVLGRWNIDYCPKKTNHKIDWSNEDHCGPCGQHNLVDTPTGEKKPRFPETK